MLHSLPVISHTVAILLGGLLWAAPSAAKSLAPLGELSEVNPINLEMEPADGLDGVQLAIDAIDPANRVAPPGLDVRSGNAAISPFLDLAMQEELTNLMGRFEGALLHGYASSQPAELALTSIRTEGSLSASLGGADLTTPLTHPALETAQQTLDDWPELM
ncbi:MAG: hypothetical protein AAFQ76_09555, partial [Cyanobacteria bacterium J06626_26]